MKKRPAKKYEHMTGLVPILGTMASESSLRASKWYKSGCNAFDEERPKSNPLSFWTEQDVLQYIYENKIPYAEVYGDIVLQDGTYRTTGVERTGCMFCAYGVHLDPEPNKFQTMAVTHPKQYSYCMRGGAHDGCGMWRPTKDGLGMAYVLDRLEIKH